MEFNIESSFGEITEEHIVAVEERYDFILPEDYKDFLLKYNGGKPKCRKFTTKNGRLTNHLMYFLPLIHNEVLCLAVAFLIFTKENELRFNIIPIGEDPIKNFVCISVAGDDFGSIYYWDFIHCDEEIPTYKYLVPIADSFTEFIEGLEESDQ
ncbi:SMI1/KNR4 family protein [Paenibacillus sp. GCM10023248]|uniref:SMI1/KNR4 family protein n=1 Tax=unclassified Paenibacillus TaxID=185978 RepID=UPI0023780DC4|nr:SMI1/KNR4 family protein [Paenibacillus sp. MAHUQ-63]MDD9266187.1 SMI1/KNR4 family protein [Paenibacillus sp. MAHUQ-63]